ncbi:hypothetical protein [uncultured Corynebacterium sp.]|uniref:hypothetical protein n=1 Tax=uncultured Corynebacterium sp. TaxID=159447 RepID=UPI002889366D|nr:hypothetical protein [uncultured Corynebacterium sp.]
MNKPVDREQGAAPAGAAGPANAEQPGASEQDPGQATEQEPGQAVVGKAPAAEQPTPTRFRRGKQLVAAFTAFAAAVCLGMVATAALNDYRIGRDQAFATADVVNVGVLRTTVRFPDEYGVYHQPDRGLLYPIGLEAGQRVRVEYQKSEPRNVKVQGRGWTLAWIPALSSLVVAMVLSGGLWLLVRWRENSWKAQQGEQ